MAENRQSLGAQQQQDTPRATRRTASKQSGRPSSSSLWLWPALLVGAVSALLAPACRESVIAEVCLETTGTEIFEQRIAPVLADDRPSSCNECHLSGVDLSLFARKSACETLACMSDQGLIDLNSPQDSTVLQWIERASPSSPLITEAVIAEEYEGMRQWIEFHADCGRAECWDVTCPDEADETFCPLQDEPLSAQGKVVDPGGCSEPTLELLFREAVYAGRRRCYPCHFDDDAVNFPDAGHWLVEGETCELSSLRTMRNVIRRGLVNAQQPEQSLLLLKPLEEIEGGLPHQGLDKFHAGDPGYEDLLYWLTRYGQCNSVVEP